MRDMDAYLMRHFVTRPLLSSANLTPVTSASSTVHLMVKNRLNLKLFWNCNADIVCLPLDDGGPFAADGETVAALCARFGCGTWLRDLWFRV